MLALTGAKKSSSLVVRPKTPLIPAAKNSNYDQTVGSKNNYLQLISVKVLEIESMITTKLIREKTKTIKDRKKAQKEDRNEQEKDLEKAKDPGKKNIKIPKVPKLGMFGWLKRFIGSIILAFFANKMLDHLPKLVGLVKGIQSVIEFVSDIGIKLVDGLATFVDWGYKAYDATQGFLKNFGVKQEQFDQFSGALSGLIDALIIGSVILAARGEDGFGPGGLDKARRPGGRKPGVTTGRGGQKSPRFRNPFGRSPVTQSGKPGMPGAPVTQGRGGKGPRPRVPGTGPKVTGGTPKGGFKFPKINLRGINAGSIAKGGATFGIGIGLDYLMNLGFSKLDAVQIQRVVNKFNSSSPEKKQEMIAKYDKLIKKYTEKTQGIGGAFDSFITLGGLLGPSSNQSLLRKFEATRAALISTQLESGKVKQYQEGGKVRKKPSRKLKKKKRTLNINRLRKPVYRPIPSAPQGSVKNKDGKPNRAWWDFLGWAGTSDGNVDLSESGANLGKRVSEVGNTLGKNDYFGPLLSLTSKIILNKNIENQDYDNVGLGINRLLNEGILKRQISEGISGYAEGGKVASALTSGIDASSWVSNTFKKDLSSDIKKQYEKIGVPGSTSGPGSTPGSRDSASGELDYTSGPAGSSGDTLTMARNLMRDLKLTEAQAAGIVGNMIAESGVENARPQNTPSGTKGPLVVDGVTGYGIVQWTSKGRQQALYDFAVSKGHDMSKPLTMDIEYQFFLKEFQGAYGSVLQQIKKAKDVKQSSTIFMQQYEIPAGYRTEAKIMERYNMSQPVYKKLSSGQGTATEGKGTYIAPQNVTAPDLSGTEQGEGTEASNRLLKDYPQIKSQNSPQQIYASGLGYFLKKSGAGRPGRGDFGDPPGGDMEHPDHGGVVASHRGSGHGRGVALDLGGNSATSGSYRDDQRKLWPYISRYLKKYGLNKEPFTPQVLHGIGESFSPVGPSSGSDGGHNDHFHVEFHDGGMVGGNGVVNSLLKTGEIVIDNDSSVAKVNPMLLAINAAKGEREVMKAISDYAPYELGAQQTVLVNNMNQAPPMNDYDIQDQGLAVMMANSYDNSFEFLDYQG
jgi:hypothetical protein